MLSHNVEVQHKDTGSDLYEYSVVTTGVPNEERGR